MSLPDLFVERRKEGNYHMGKLLHDCLTRKPRDGVCQIDAATGAKETYGSVLSRSVQLARCLRQLGFAPGDVLALGGNNHLDVHIVYYAGLFNGMPISGVDPQFRYCELKRLFNIVKPKIAFCEPAMREEYKKAIEDLRLDTKIVVFRGDTDSFEELMAVYGDNEAVEAFRPSEFDTTKFYAWLVSTSGTTGGLKVAAIEHGSAVDMLIEIVLAKIMGTRPSLETRIGLHLSPVQWTTSFFNAISFIFLDLVKVQTSRAGDLDHVVDIINQYKPVYAIFIPSFLWSLMTHEKHCDLTCFNLVTIAGGKAFKELYAKAKERLRPGALLSEGYGQTETLGPLLMTNPKSPVGSCGVSTSMHQVKLMDPETGKEITEPNVPGELWSRGPSFKEYYNDPETTAASFSDGWYRTGDLLYRDEDGNFFFVERIKMLIKCRGYHIIPTELEELILSHPGVEQVCVTAISHREDGQRPVACVVRRVGKHVSAREIKDLVSNTLSPTKSLRGGVVFLDELPLTSSGKVARAKVNEFVGTAERELAE